MSETESEIHEMTLSPPSRGPHGRRPPRYERSPVRKGTRARECHRGIHHAPFAEGGPGERAACPAIGRLAWSGHAPQRNLGVASSSARIRSPGLSIGARVQYRVLMLRRFPLGLLLVGVWGCNTPAQGIPGSESPTAGPGSVTLPGPGAESTRTPSRVRAPAAEARPACTIATPAVRMRVNAGQILPTGTGLEVGHEGWSHDNYGPAGTDSNVSLVFRRGPDEERRLLSTRDHAPRPVLGHCFRLVDAGPGAALLEIGALPMDTLH